MLLGVTGNTFGFLPFREVNLRQMFSVKNLEVAQELAYSSMPARPTPFGRGRECFTTNEVIQVPCPSGQAGTLVKPTKNGL